MLNVKIVIIGGGAAGMMAAATVAEQSHESKVILIERNRILGQKVRLTGGGRCNVTTGRNDMEDILRRYPRGRNFVKHAFYDFPPQKVMEWFGAHGVPLKTEEDLRVFPQSDKGDDVVGAFEKLFEKTNVELMLGTTVERVEKIDGRFVLELSDRQSVVDSEQSRRAIGNRQSLSADRVMISSGGEARATGHVDRDRTVAGGGYALAAMLGHTITPLAPSLSSFVVQEPWVKELAGVSFKSVRMKIRGSGEHEFTGPFVFTHKGVTGPAVFALSSLAAYEKLTVETPSRLLIDLLPDTPEATLAQELRKGIAAHPKKTFENLLSQFVPKSVSTVICQSVGIPAERIAVEVSKKDFNKSVAWLKGVPLTVVGRGAGDEFVTAGGVSLKEIDSKTMESKICPGLFFGGEVLDVDGFTGGYNLQVAWATGRLAGMFLTRA